MGTALRILGRLLFVYTSAVLAMVEVPASRADTVEQVNFTVQVTTSSENGDVFSGAYTFDRLLLCAFTCFALFVVGTLSREQRLWTSVLGSGV
jgi:hypothetical protein